MNRRFRSMVEIVSGTLLLLIGLVLALPGVPGPGIAVILGGLFILRNHFTWAKRLTLWIEEKVHAMKLRHKLRHNATGAGRAPD